MKRKILVAVPNYTNTLRGEMADSLLTAGLEATRAGWEFDVRRVPDSIHHIARNNLLGYFLHGDWSDLVWWDDDVAILPGTFVPFVEHDVPFVCAAYRHKRDEESYPGAWPELGERKMRESLSTKTPLFNAKYWVIGFSRQTRECVHAIAHRPEVEWGADDAFPGVPIPDVFHEEAFLQGGKKHKFGEDYVYVRAHIDLGGEIWVDPMMATGHAGRQIWWGRMGAQMQREVEAYRRELALDELQVKLRQVAQ